MQLLSHLSCGREAFSASFQCKFIRFAIKATRIGEQGQENSQPAHLWVLGQEGCGLGQRGEGLGGAGVDRATLIQHISTALQMQAMLQTNRAPDAHSFAKQMYAESPLRAGEEEARMAGLPARSMPASGGPVRLPALL